MSNREVAAVLISFDHHQQFMSPAVVFQPPSGSLLLYDRNVTKFRKDGWNWDKRPDGKATREDHAKLKVAHSLQRRSFLSFLRASLSGQRGDLYLWLLRAQFAFFDIGRRCSVLNLRLLRAHTIGSPLLTRCWCSCSHPMHIGLILPALPRCIHLAAPSSVAHALGFYRAYCWYSILNLRGALLVQERHCHCR